LDIAHPQELAKVKKGTWNPSTIPRERPESPQNNTKLKMHCQNIVDGRCVQKEFFKNIFVK
jgi:hypothetical protein